MTVNFLKSIPLKTLPFLVLILGVFFITSCKTDVSSKKQQKAFYVDANGNLLNKKDELVRRKGDFKLEDGFFVDNNGEPIKRNIDKTKEKINATVDNTKEKLSEAAANTKEKLSNAAAKTTEGVKSSFKKMFNTKAVGQTYELEGIAFKPKSHRISDMSKAEVEGLAAALKEHPEARIQVQVHTAEGHDKIECKKLSKLRAEVVKDMMVTLGVNADQISSKGLGLTAEDAEKAVANKVEVVVEK